MSEGQIEFIIADLSRFSEREIVSLALNVDSTLRANPPIGTPIDTGWASANWVPSVGAAALFPDVKGDPTPAQIATRRQAGQQGLNEVLAWNLGEGPIFVTNGVPYIQKLNDGHSPQSPPGFVQKAVAQAIEETYAEAAGRASGGSGL